MIIGISGLAGSGKDTAADFLVRDHGFLKVSVADPMKRFCADVFGWDEERLWGSSENRNSPDPRFPRVEVAVDPANANNTIERHTFLSARKALQYLGTEVGRELYGNVWIEYAMKTAKALLTSDGFDYDRARGVFRAARTRPSGIAIPDVRFKNELEAIRKAGGKLVRITRPGAGLKGSTAVHQSEAEMAGIPDDDFDFVVENTTGSIARYRDQIESLVNVLRPR